MFGSRDELGTLRAQVETLAGQVDSMTQQIASVRALLDDTDRLGELAGRVEQLRRDAEAALAALERRAEVVGVAQPRFRPKLNLVYRAETPGFVSVWFTGGRTDRIRLLVGDQDPPTEPVCEADSGYQTTNSYVGGIVRTGERWMVESRQGERSGFRCIFTPLR